MPRGRKRRSRRAPSSSSSSSSSTSSSSDGAARRRKRKRRQDKSPTVSQNAIVSSVIPEFDPLVDDIDMWIMVVEANARAFGWTDSMIKFQALQKLRNTSKTWLDSLQKNETRWTTWKWKQWRDTLSDTFQVKRNMYILLKQLIDTKPLPNQSLYEFFFKQKGKIDSLRLNFREQDIISIIVGTIGDSQISIAAEAGSFKYCDDLASFLHNKAHITHEKDLSQRQSSSQPKHTVRQSQSNQSNMNKSMNRPEVSKQFTHLAQNNNYIMTCYRCGESGHKRNTCTLADDVQCSNCNKRGHVELACKSKLKPKVETSGEVKMISQFKTKQKFHKKVLLDNIECEAFFDMGSDCSLITTEFVNKLKLQPFSLKNSINLVGFTGSSGTQVTQAVAIKLKVDSVELITTFYAIDMLTGCNILVGRNFTEDKSIMYVRIGDSLTFHPINSLNVCNIDTLKNVPQQYVSVIQNIFSKFPSCISQNLSTLGKTTSVELDINLTSDKPIYQRPYRMSQSDRTQTRELVDELIQNGIIRNSKSAYASPALLVDKASGSKRLCVDYRQLNKITVKEKYPMPLIEDLIDRLEGCRYYTSLDLKSGYHQIPIKTEDIHKTAFITPDGHFEYLRMPFGLCNGPSVFQKLMNTVLGNLRFGNVICYMDDLLIATKTMEENITCLEEVLELLQKNGLTINLDKCNFLQNDIRFLGYDVSEQGIRPSPKKLDAIANYPTPKTIHQLRQFLGLINYFRKFIKNCALISKPLTSLLKKNVIWKWTPEHDHTVATLKNLLINNATLNIFNPKLPISLYTDASRDGLGCILMQKTESGDKPICFYSRQTTNEEKKYHSFELELLAIVVGLQKFRHYLLGTQFSIITDCSAVRHALCKKEIIPRISRWILQTQEFTFDIFHRPGPQMQHVDALSRNPVAKSNISNLTESVMTITEGDWLLSVQLQDPNICCIRDILKSGEAESHRQIFNEYELLGNKVYRSTEFGRRWLVPKQCIWYIIRANHDDIGHFAVDKTIERIKSKYWFPRLKKIVSKYVKNCIYCIYYKNAHGKKPGKLYPIPKHARPFHTLHIDHLGPFIKTTQNNNYLLVIVDSFTKFVFIAAVRNTKSKVVINELNKIFKVFGNPKRLISDAGSAFTSKLFSNFCKDRNIRSHVIATAVPRSNGQVERYNQTILEALRSMGAYSDNNNWDQHITSIQQGINSTINKTTAAVPSEVFFGYRIRMNGDAIVDDDNTEQAIDVTTLRNTVDNNIKKNAIKQKTSFDAKRKEAPLYSIGDLVVLKIPSHNNDGQSKKLLPLYKGPFQITSVLGHDRYQVADMRGAERSSKQYDGVACVENMKPWIQIGD